MALGDPHKKLRTADLGARAPQSRHPARHQRCDGMVCSYGRGSSRQLAAWQLGSKELTQEVHPAYSPLSCTLGPASDSWELSIQTQGLPTGNIPYSNYYTRHYLQTNKQRLARRDRPASEAFAAQVDTQSSQSWEGDDTWMFRVHCLASLDFSVTSMLTKGTVSNARCTGSGGPFYSLPPICLVALEEAEGGCGSGS